MRLPVPGTSISRSWRFRSYQLNVHSPSLSHVAFHRPRTPAPTYRNFISFPMVRKPRRVNFWRGWPVPLLIGTGIVSYIIITGNPLRLESNPGILIEKDEIDQKYIPLILPYSMNEANEALRWEESSKICGMGSGVLRCDSVRVPSNLPCEDEIISALGQTDDEIKWLLWGLFDGHA